MKNFWTFSLFLSVTMFVSSIILLGLQMPIGLLFLILGPILFVFALLMLSPYWEAEKREEEKKKAEQAQDEGKIYTTSASVKALFQHFSGVEYVGQDNYSCPICQTKLAIDHNYKTTEYVKDQKIIEGAYVASTITGQAKQAWQWVNERKEFPAKCITCPSCEYKLYKARYSTYDTVTTFERDEDGGANVTREEYCEYDKFAFVSGKLQENAFLELQNDKKFFYKLVSETEFLKK